MDGTTGAEESKILEEYTMMKKLTLFLLALALTLSLCACGGGSAPENDTAAPDDAAPADPAPAVQQHHDDVHDDHDYHTIITTAPEDAAIVPTERRRSSPRPRMRTPHRNRLPHRRLSRNRLPHRSPSRNRSRRPSPHRRPSRNRLPHRSPHRSRSPRPSPPLTRRPPPRAWWAIRSASCTPPLAAPSPPTTRPAAWIWRARTGSWCTTALWSIP